VRVRVVKTRPPFPHGKHIRRMGATLMMWAPFYLGAYLWHRFGPTKSVSYVSTEGFHSNPQSRSYGRADFPQTDQWGRLWVWSYDHGQWMYVGHVGATS